MRKIFIALVASLLVSVGSTAMLRQAIPANLQQSSNAPALTVPVKETPAAEPAKAPEAP